MDLPELTQTWLDSSNKLKEIIQYVFEEKQKNKKKENITVEDRRKLLSWAMRVLVNQIIGGNEDIQTDVLQKFTTKKYILDRFQFLNDNCEKIGRQSLKPALAGIHFRSSLLEDGRETLAASLLEEMPQNVKDIVVASDDPIAIGFHKELLKNYFELYTRPLTFNEKLLTLADRESEYYKIHICHLDFNNEPSLSILEESYNNRDKIREWKIHFSESLIRDLTNYLNYDIPNSILDRVLNKLNRNTENITIQSEDDTSLFRMMREAVEMSWHKILGQEDAKNSYETWKNFLSKLKFIPSELIEESTWNPLTREALLQGLWFLQGIALYEKLVPGELVTISFEFDDQVYGALTLGFKHDKFKILNLNNQVILKNLSQLLETILTGALASVNSSALSLNETPPPLMVELQDQNIFDKFKEEIPIFVANSQSQETLVRILKICKSLCTAVHEQHPLEFQFFVGSGSELGSFREIYSFTEPERRDFETSNTIIWLNLLKAHYSHLQQRNRGIFIEIEERINPRIVETLLSEKILPFVCYLADDDSFNAISKDSTSQQQTSINITRRTQNLVVVRCGFGKVWLYANGKILLRWPKKETPDWWSPLAEKSWDCENYLEKFIKQASQKLNQEIDNKICQKIAEALLWISEQPGLGCSLVIVESKTENIQNCCAQLNPKKLDWIRKFSLNNFTKNELQNTLMQDGATLLDLQEKSLEGQQLIVPIDGTKISQSKNITTEERLNYGTRHTSALDFTWVLKDKGCAIVVSADGPISVFVNGERKTPHDLENNSLWKKSRINLK